MTQAMPAGGLRSTEGKLMTLSGMQVEGVLDAGLAVITLTQQYVNPESVNIEAVYSFPLPVRAVLLEMAVTLDGQSLHGSVIERSAAEARYEDAIADGDSAVMLEQVEPGYYVMNVGNLMPEAQATIRMRFALPLEQVGGQIRLSIPTTIAPRFGDAAGAGLTHGQAPATDVFNAHGYRLCLLLRGALARTAVQSPTHRIDQQGSEDGLVLQLADGQVMADHDLVLLMQGESCPDSVVAHARDQATDVALATFYLPVAATCVPLIAKILVDGSGSMAGDSIALARRGALHVIGQLRAEDRFAIAAFGNTVEFDPELGARLHPATQVACHCARNAISRMDALLGGTQMLGALQEVFAIRATSGTHNGGGDVLLITDGEVWNRQEIVDAARRSAHRIFVIGVGTSPAELLIRQIAEATGGAAVFVGPGEEMIAAIDRQLARMRTPRVTEARIETAGTLLWQAPSRLEARALAGDTLRVALGGTAINAGPVTLQLRYADGTECRLGADGSASPTIEGGETVDRVRIAAALRVEETIFEQDAPDRELLAELAVRHQLMSPYTHYLFVHEQGENAARHLPELRRVGNALPAGWGGTSSVGRRVVSESGRPAFSRQVVGDSGVRFSRMPIQSRAENPVEVNLNELIQMLNDFADRAGQGVDLPLDLHGDDGLMLLWPLGPGVENALRTLVRAGEPEAQVVMAFWLALQERAPADAISRRARRLIASLQKRIHADPDHVRMLFSEMGDALSAP